MSKDTTTRTVICPTPGCGCTIYTATYAIKYVGNDAVNDTESMQPIWRCCNCQAETPRHSRSRKSLRARRWEVISEIRKAWESTDEELRQYVDLGFCKGGALLVHSSTFNWHLGKLAENDKITRRDLGYHSAHANEDLERAKQFAMQCWLKGVAYA